MEATLDAARASFPGRRLVLAFQPHRYTRTRDLFEDFVRVLSTVDALVLADVYPAGEAPIVAADGRALARAVRVAGKVEPVFVEDVADLPATIRTLARDGDVVLTMGAGSIGATASLLIAMMMHEPLHFTGLRGTLTRNAPLAKYTSWRAGGAGGHAVCAGRSRRSRRVPAPVARRGAVDGARPRQQHARARRRRARHGRRSCTTRARRSPSPTASSTRMPAPRARSSRASPRCTAARKRSSWPACPAPSAARSR